VERALVQVWTTKLLNTSLVEMSRGENELTILMLTEKDIFGN
jgi:hypothetical protein